MIKRSLFAYYKFVSVSTNNFLYTIHTAGRFLFFIKDVLSRIMYYRPNYNEVLNQIYYIGIKSILVVSVTGFFAGSLVCVNLHMMLNVFGADTFMGGLNVSSSFRELTPLIISFIIASKVGVYTTAELGAMKVSDEIDTLKSLAIDPIRYLIVPRFLGVLFSSFSLLIFGLFMSFIGGLITSITLGIHPVQYVKTIPIIVSIYSFIYAIVKCFIFGFLVACIGCFMGFNARGGSQDLGKTTRLTAEILIVALIFVDYLLAMFVNMLMGKQ